MASHHPKLIVLLFRRAGKGYFYNLFRDLPSATGTETALHQELRGRISELETLVTAQEATLTERLVACDCHFGSWPTKPLFGNQGDAAHKPVRDRHTAGRASIRVAALG